MLSMTSGRHTQNQPLGNSCFYTEIEAMVRLRREPKLRGGHPKSKKMTSLKKTSIKENGRYGVWGQKNNFTLTPNYSQPTTIFLMTGHGAGILK